MTASNIDVAPRETYNTAKERGLVRSAALDYIRQRVPLCLLFGVEQRNGSLVCACDDPSCAKAGKHPRHRNWPKNFITTESELLRQFPTTGAVNLGFVLRKQVFVIDVDAKGDGAATVADLERRFGKLPYTLTTATSNGGNHRYFQAPPGVCVGNSVRRVGPGIDIRGLRGYVVLPPSLHVTGARYRFLPPATISDLGRIAQAPFWLLELVQKPNNRPLQLERHCPPAIVGEGERNDQAARLAGSLFNYCPLEWVECFLSVWNSKFCTPPMSPAELEAVVRNISRRHEARKRGQQL